jgi:itaconate CoA-transferase
VKGLSAYFVWLNRSKESLTLDIKHPKAADILSKLIAGADVFLQNLAPGAARRLGLDADTLLAKHPKLIVADISGYGDSGPYAHKKAYDLLVQSEAGVLSVTGTPEQQCKVGISIVDIAAGMYAYSGILTALYQRERTGKGTRVEVTMFEALGEWMSNPLLYTHFSGKPLRRSGPDHATIVPYGRFKCGGGSSVMMGIQNEREWVKFCAEVLGDAKLAQDKRYDNNAKRLERRAEVVDLIERVFGAFSADQVMAKLDAAGIANARVNTAEELWEHAQLKARSRWREVGSAAGPIQTLLPPVTMPGFEARMDAIPAIGEHTDRILAELGYKADEIGALRESAAV